MINSLTALILIASICASYAETVPYTGFRVSLKKEVMGEVYNGIYKTAAESLKAEKWSDLVEDIGSGLFSLGFSLTNIKCAQATFDASKVSRSIQVRQNSIEVVDSGAGLTSKYDFTYEFHLMGMTLFFGTGSLSLNSVKTTMTQAFLGKEIATFYGIDWKLEGIQLSGYELFGGVTAWTTRMMTSKHYQAALNVLKNAIHKGTNAFMNKWYELKTPFYEDGSLDMVLINSVYLLNEAAEGYVSFGFATRVAVEDRPYNRTVWRLKKNSPLPESSAQVCVAENLISNMVEIRGKARDFIFIVDPVSIGLSGHLSDLMQAMPQLAEHFDENDVMTIGCRPNGDNDIVTINDGKLSEEHGRLEIPLTCAFGDMPSGATLLSAGFVLRANTNKVVELVDGFYSINGNVVAPTLYSYKVDSSIAPVEDIDQLVRIFVKVAGLINNFKLLPRGLVVKAPIIPTTATKTITADEYCFNYA